MTTEALPDVQAAAAVTLADDQLVPRLIADAGADAAKRFLEFFAVTIRNPNTRAAYARACRQFFAWCDHAGVGQVVDVEPIHVAAYVEAMATRYEPPTVTYTFSCALEKESLTGNLGQVRAPDRPALAQFQCNGAMVAARLVSKAPLLGERRVL